MSIFDLFKKSSTNQIPPFFYKELVAQITREVTSAEHWYWEVKPSNSPTYKKEVVTLSNDSKLKLVLEGIEVLDKIGEDAHLQGYDSERNKTSKVLEAVLKDIIRSKPKWSEEQLIFVIDHFIHFRLTKNGTIFYWPLSHLFSLIDKHFAGSNSHEAFIFALKQLKEAIQKEKGDEKDKLKLAGKLDVIIFRFENGEGVIKECWFREEDDFGSFANASIASMEKEERSKWFSLLAHAQKASGGSPSSKYLKEACLLVKELGEEEFKATLLSWFGYLASLKDKTVHINQTFGDEQVTWSQIEFISPLNYDPIKGFVWMSSFVPAREMLQSMTAVAARTFKKIPGKGMAAPAVGNACLWMLANVKGLEGVSHLSRLKLKARQANTQTLIEKYLLQAAKEQGITIEEIEDRAIQSYELENGERTFEFGDFKARLSLVAPGKAKLDWFKKDGSPQKSVPTSVKEGFKSELNELKDLAKGIEETLAAQRDRLDQMFRYERKLTWKDFEEYYFSHGLMSFLTRPLIWTFTSPDKTGSAIFLGGKWINPDGELSFSIGEDTTLAIWHPVNYSTSEVKAWRDFLSEHGISQPIKQAFREVYLLTDAEINTSTYSNRMAAHVLKQHQFNSLAKTRGWKYSLMGGFDHGVFCATLPLPRYGLYAEFWVNEVPDQNSMSETGIWLYISTDQVRFYKEGSREPLLLVEVPRMIFSEVMRDVDLFVGVASVGNDPQWRDNGNLPQYRNYWQSYSFGELGEFAKTRKEQLQKILPRLRIAKACELTDRFLVVKGKLRTYKIHLGSTNILMEPNDQYLCIVPDHKKKSENELLLPFEGDSGLSVILSKALLLSEDDKIKDPTITSQIRMN